MSIMPLDRKRVLQLAEDSQAFLSGEELYRKGQARIVRADSFWRGEKTLGGEVREGGNTWFPTLSLRQGDLGSMTCGCGKSKSKTKMCRHLVAAAFAVIDYEKKLSAPSVSTSQEMRKLLGDYGSYVFSQELVRRTAESLKLIPLLHWKEGEICLSLSLSGACSGKIQDLEEFARAMEQGQAFKVGRQTITSLHIDMFVREDRELAGLIRDIVLNEAEKAEKNSRSRTVRMAGEGMLLPDRSQLDEIMDCLMGRQAICEAEGYPAAQLLTEDRNPRLSLVLEKTGRDGIALRIPQQFRTVEGRGYLYVWSGESLYRADRSYLKGPGRLLRAMEQTKDRRLLLQERDMSGFYDYYQKEIRPAYTVSPGEVDMEKYRPGSFIAEFYVDSPEAGEVTLRVRYRYGDVTVSPFDSQIPAGVSRNLAGEKLIAGVIRQYFHARYPGQDGFVIRENDEEIYRFLSQGVRELAELGEVYVAERVQKIQRLSGPRVSIGIMARGDWFDLTVDAEGISREELMEALVRYRRKEKYIHLKNGDFLKLDEKEIGALAELYDSLEPEDDSGSGELRMPACRAFYVDQLTGVVEGARLSVAGEYRALIDRLKKAPEIRCQVPEALDGIMKDYQKQGFYWMKSLDYLGFGGILADEMGLGKTLQAISLLTDESLGGKKNVSLIVCPASLVYNWKHELETYAPELACASVAGDAEERREVLTRALEYQVLITSYDLLKRDIELYADIGFRYCFIDEAQYIKNHLTQNAKAVKQIRAGTRFALTGTPIENRLGELWSIMDFLMPGLLYSYSRFCREIEQPAVRGEGQEALEKLHRLIAPFVLRRLKKDVLKELPDKLETVVYSRMEGEQRKLYAANALALRSRLTGVDDAQYKKERMQVLAELTRLRQICCDPALYYEDYRGGSAKLEACIELVMRSIAGGHKILLFSQFTTMLDRIGERLQEADIGYYELTGQTGKQERIELAERFNSDNVPVFLISLKAGGTGLNLTAADVVIHYDPWWNVAAQNQATDRAHRLGQQHVVSVFKLITRSTIEENILTLQESKRQLAEKMIGGSGGYEAALGREELIALLEERRLEDEFY